ncbi:type II toxin-antitoxin system VapC family toxin [Sphingomonas adhaesiva]|uniref:type II toxin-antitoxin system VapC family toxin n=1 Tax=Sphingomonas adhaesiva TaxID=28212 RepID=UPI002FFAB4C8
MRTLLDTHALLWWWLDDAALPERTRRVIEDAGNEVFVSAATGWEIAMKVRRGKLAAIEDRMPRFEQAIADDGFRPLAVSMTHGLRAGALPGIHSDPFDRILAAQALVEGLVLVTRDRAILDFGCETLW